MHPVLLIPVFACALAALIAAAILARDPGQRANRLIAMVLLSSAWWSLCEVVWNLQDDPELVLWLIKLSSLGWLWLGEHLGWLKIVGGAVIVGGVFLARMGATRTTRNAS